MAKNSKKLQIEIDSIQEARKNEFDEFDKERIKLAETHADKDDAGKAIIENNAYKISDMTKFNEEFSKLREKYEITAKEEAFDNFMKEEIDVELHTIKEENLPEDITAGQIEAIFDLIEE
jgi:hypothetical protein